MADNYHTIPANEAGDTTPANDPDLVNPTGLTNNALGFLMAFEGPGLTPYVDGVHINTVGIGFNLTLSNYAQLYLAEINIEQSNPNYSAILGVLTAPKGSYTSNAALTSALTEANGGTPLPSLTAAEDQDLWNQIVLSTSPTSQYESFYNLVSNPSRNIDYTDLLNSKEGVALFSMFYNGAFGARSSPALMADLNQNATQVNGQSSINRPDAWFQIRYGTNPHDSGGVAARRYAESELFGLYAPTDQSAADVTNDEATQIYAEFSKANTENPGVTNRLFAFDYELSLSSQINSANSTIGGAVTDSPILSNVQVQTLESELSWASQELVNNYVSNTSLNPWVGDFAGTTIDSLDVQVATEGGGNDLQASYRSGYNLYPGIDTGTVTFVYENSLLVAQGGNDTLDGSGTGNDALIGGTGNEKIIGGTGNDYIVAGTGNDYITLVGGSDTVVLGDSNNSIGGGQASLNAGHDTLDATQDSGNFTVYVDVGSSETIMLGSGNPTIDLVSGQGQNGITPSTLTINAQWIAPGEWYDKTDDALIVQQPGAGGQLNLNASEKNIVVTYGQPTSTQGSLGQALSLSQLEQVYAADSSSSGTSSLGTEITLDDFSGSDDDGVDLGAEPPASTLTGSNNLSQLYDEGLSGDTAPGGDAEYVYVDGYQGNNVSAVYGSNSSGAPYGNQIDGDGVASFVSAGDGANTVILGNYFDTATTPTANALNATIVGGSGDQDLIGVGNGSETITGGALGSDTTASTYIDGGGATADLTAGGQNSVIFGGTGANDTLVAGENDGTAGSSFEPSSALIAGLSFWGDAYSTITGGSSGTYYEGALPEVSWDESFGNDTASIVVDISLYQSNNTFATPFNLLGSSYDSGEAGSTTLSGSLLIGGTGQDALIGNSGNDTIIGGDPGDISSSSINEALVGGAGSNLIYGGSGNEVIFADMGPSGVTDWADLDTSASDTVYAGDGTDFIYGSGGNDSLYGGAGTDVINVGNGSSYVDAGSGNSSVYGGTGNDTIIANGSSDYIETGDGNSSVSVGAGQDTITLGAGNDTVEADQGGSALITEANGAVTLIAGPSTGSDTVQMGTGGTTIQLGENLDESNLIVRDVNGDLVLTDGGAMALTLQDYFGGGGNVAIQFEDGVTWGAQQILQASMTPSSDGSPDTLVGSNGNDDIAAGYGNTLIVGVSGNNTLTGGEAADTIDGGTGADTIEGGSGTTTINGGTGLETYIYNEGDGSDTIFENTSTAGNDSISFGAGLSASDLSFSYYSPNDILTITDTTSGQTITIDNFVATTDSQHQIAALAFADGTSMSQLQVIQQADLLQGTTGNDSLIGDSLENYIDGLGGDDTEVGDGGNDTFVFKSGYGQLEVNETYSTGQVPVLLLGAGITESSIKVTSDGANLILTDGVSGDEVKLDGMLNNTDDGVAQVQFADGTTLTATQLLQMELEGSSGNDTIYGTTGADIIDGKGGNDLVVGDGGSDTFVFNAGYGHLEIQESYSVGQQPILQFGPGIDPSDINVTTDGSSLFLTDGISGDQVELDDENDALSPNQGVASVDFADGTSFTEAQLIQLLQDVNGTTGNDELIGTSGADRFDGRGGNDTVYGEGGSDTFVFNQGYGDLTIYENYSSGQEPVLQFGAGITASSIKVTTDGENVFVTDGVTGDQIELETMWALPGYGVASVEFADGTSLTGSQFLEMAVTTTGTSGNDTMYGTSEAELFDGKGGNDYIVGGGGDDSFVFNSGYGQLEINEFNASGAEGVLELGSGITESSLTVSLNAQSGITLTDGVAGDEIVLYDAANGGGYGIGEIQFSDGSTISGATLLEEAREINGTTGNDTLQPTASQGQYNNYVFDGKGGDDVENAYSGYDTFVFDAGYGKLEINNNNFTGPQDSILKLGSGITAADLHITTNGTDLIITDGINGDEITIINGWGTNNAGDGEEQGYGIGAVEFADGSTLTADQLVQMEMTGTTGNDSIIGTPGNDLIDGKGGNDTVYGDGGQDTIVFNAGYGDLTVKWEYGTDPQTILKVGGGLTASNLQVAMQGSSIVVTDGVAGDQITIEAGINGNNYGIGELQFDDGSVLTLAQLQQMATQIVGTTGNDSLVGTSGADLIDGKGGNDTVSGDGGQDTFVYNAGYGDLNISEYGSGNAVLKFGAGITASSLHVSTVAATSTPSPVLGSTYITDGINGDEITLNDMWDSNGGIGKVQFADGSTLTYAQLEQLEMTGTSGSDTIYGTLGNDVIDGKGGSDIVYGSEFSNDAYQDQTGEGAAGDGSDTFVYNAGYGQLTIYDQYLAGSQNPIIQFGPGITASSLQVTSGGDASSLFITDGVTGDEITIVDMEQGESSWGTTWGVAGVQFADGTSLTAQQLLQMTLDGTPGNDSINGTPGADYLDGKGGNDTIWGDGGSDTFVFNAGYGKLEIDENTYPNSGYPILQLGGGITASDLHVTYDGTNAYITDGVAGDEITIEDQWDTNQGIDEVTFDDGTSLTATQLAAIEETGTTGDDTLYAINNDDVIDGKGGDDSIVGGPSGDTFVFDQGYGHLTISNDTYWETTTPVLQLGAGITASTLRVSGIGDNLVLTDGISGDQVTIQDVLLTNNGTTQSGIGEVEFADGTTLSQAQLVQMEMTGTTGNDTMAGTLGADLLDGKGGDDSITGNGGSDTFVFNAGYGDLEINESYATSDTPILQLGPGITTADLHVVKSGNNLVITDGIAGDQITLDGMDASSTDGVATIDLSDGTTLSRSQLLQMLFIGTSGNDTITGTTGAELIDGRGGDDSVVGDGGNDTFVFDSGYGQLTINEVYKSGQAPVLELGAGITASSLHATKSGNNLVLTDGVSGDQITLVNMWTTSTDGVASLELSDGTALTRAQMIALEMTGTSGNDTITGTTGADLIDGKGGTDSVTGDGGNDTFVFNSGYGSLTINEVYTSGQTPVLELGAGITQSALHATKSGNNLVITDGVSGDQITLVNMWTTSTDGVASLELSGGTTLTRAQIIALEMTGTTGNDTITGTTGADLIDGKGGTDSVTGDGGNDTFVFNSGYGHLTINETYTSGQSPVLQFGAGITSSSLTVKESGSNMVITDGVSGDQITLDGMWNTATDGVGTVTFTNGTSLTRAQLLTMGGSKASVQSASEDTSQSSAPTVSATPKQNSNVLSSVNQVDKVDGVPVQAAPLIRDFTKSSVGSAVAKLSASMASTSVQSQVNSLIHAMAGFSGGVESEGLSSTIVPPNISPDLYIHTTA